MLSPNQPTKPISMPLTSPDLSKQPPRSARVRLGGYVILPRMLDKGRATVTGKNGEYHYNCPLDQQFLNFVGIDAEALKAELAAGKSDTEILGWIQTNAKSPKARWEIDAWTTFQDRRGPDSDAETLEFFAGYVKQFTTVREDIRSWFDVLDVDDFVSFGGKA